MTQFNVIPERNDLHFPEFAKYQARKMIEDLEKDHDMLQTDVDLMTYILEQAIENIERKMV